MIDRVGLLQRARVRPLGGGGQPRLHQQQLPVALAEPTHGGHAGNALASPEQVETRDQICFKTGRAGS